MQCLSVNVTRNDFKHVTVKDTSNHVRFKHAFVPEQSLIIVFSKNVFIRGSLTNELNSNYDFKNANSHMLVNIQPLTFNL